MTIVGKKSSIGACLKFNASEKETDNVETQNVMDGFCHNCKKQSDFSTDSKRKTKQYKNTKPTFVFYFCRMRYRPSKVEKYANTTHFAVVGNSQQRKFCSSIQSLKEFKL